MDDFEFKLKQFIERSQVIVNDYYQKNYPLVPPPMLYPIVGGKYIKIACRRVNEEHGSAWAFIEKVSGTIYKAASWKAPAKTPRGSIRDDDGGMSMIGPFGPDYVRGPNYR